MHQKIRFTPFFLTITIFQVEYYSFKEQNNYRSHELDWIKQFDSILQVGSLLPGHTVREYRFSGTEGQQAPLLATKLNKRTKRALFPKHQFFTDYRYPLINGFVDAPHIRPPCYTSINFPDCLWLRNYFHSLQKN